MVSEEFLRRQADLKIGGSRSYAYAVKVKRRRGTASIWRRKGEEKVELTFLPCLSIFPSAILNRETRDALAPIEQAHLHSTFRYVGLGLAITAASAYQLHRTGFSAKVRRLPSSTPLLLSELQADPMLLL